MSRVRDLASILTASSSMATDVEVTTAVSNHSAASDPHPGYVLESLIDAKGDLIVGSADNTVAKLSTGNSGESIVVDSSTSTGLRYQGSMTAGKNAIINSAFDVWQRGTSFSVAANTGGAYYADRWMADTNANQASTFSRQATGDTTNLPGIQYCFRFQRNSGQTGTGVQALITSLETVNSIPLAGKTVTLSFYARAGANYSAASNGLVYRLLTGTGTDQNALMVGYTGQATTINEIATLTTTWQRFSTSIVIPAATTEIAIYFRNTFSGTAGAADYFEVTGVQLEVGSVATLFSRNAGTIQGELAACYRYFQKFGGTQVNESFPYIGFSYSTTQGEGPLTHKGTMRTTPSVAFSTLKVSDVATYNLAVTNLALTSSGSGPDASYLVFTVASGTSSGKINYMRTDATTAGYLYLNAEL
jgi:hypothetical protein